MEEELKQQFIKGFNAGYQLIQHAPELLNKLLSQQNKTNEFFQGMDAGKKQHEKEKFLSQFKSNDKSKDVGREL